MRPVFIGVAIAWILFTVVTSFRLLYNAPVIFGVCLIIPILILIYGLLAEEPRADKSPDTAVEKSGQQGDSPEIPPKI
jgi:ABC-type bacteriocin/lantibiotic exporter with double-glycine peptidase domain